MKRRDILLRGVVLIGTLTFGYLVGCPIYKIFKIPCPCCGTTRAWISFLKGEFLKAFHYNPLFMPITLFLVLFVFEKWIFKLQKTKNIFFVISGTIVFLLYIVRIWQGAFIF